MTRDEYHRRCKAYSPDVCCWRDLEMDQGSLAATVDGQIVPRLTELMNSTRRGDVTSDPVRLATSKGTPREVTAKLEAAVRKALDDTAF
jgi:hypothetical protein